MAQCTVIKIKHITNVFIKNSSGYKILRFDKSRFIEEDSVNYSFGQDLLWGLSEHPEAKIKDLIIKGKY